MARYFHHVTPGGTTRYWRDSSEGSYSGIHVHINMNLLATAVGDSPPDGVTLVKPQRYDTGVAGVGEIDLQPFVELRRGLQVELPIGPNLKSALDYPIGGLDRLNLSLPFYDPALGIGDTGGGWFTNAESGRAFHGGWDVTPRSADDLFEVCAAADGVILGISKGRNKPIVIGHSHGVRDFLTIYQHLDLADSELNVNEPVKRGQFLGRIADDHLHFMVAVEGPEFTSASGALVPSLWYAIDPFGVYDVYRNRSDLATYNYLPDRRPECFSHRIQGSNHIIQWAAQPVIRTLPVVELTDGYLKIVRMQFRARDNAFRLGLPPAEVNQCLVWLEGIDGFFFVPLDAPSGDRDVESGCATSSCSASTGVEP